MSKIAVTLVKTRNYNNELRTMNYELLFKSNPIKPNWTAEHFTEKSIDSPRLANKIRRSSND